VRKGSIDDPASAYVPGLANVEYGNTSIIDLLHMASDVSFTDYYNRIDDVARLWVGLFGDQGKDTIGRSASLPATKGELLHQR
jgi:hypothetical protein